MKNSKFKYYRYSKYLNLNYCIYYMHGEKGSQGLIGDQGMDGERVIRVSSMLIKKKLLL